MKFLSIAALLVAACSCTVQVSARISPTRTCSSSNLLTIRGGSGGLDDLSSLDWRYFAAGGICAAFSHGITTPIDVVKTRMQTDPEQYTKGVLSAAGDIVAKEGVGYLLAGLGPTVVGYGLEGALKFGFYETFKVVFAGLTTNKFFNLLMASVIAGAIASIVLCPMEEARIKMVGDASWAKENVVSSIVRMVREDGLLSSFSGLPAMLAKQVPYTMGKQVSFDLIAALLYTAVAQLAINTSDAALAISLCAAFLTSVIACLSSQPGDMILTATYGAHGAHGKADVHSDAHSGSADHIKNNNSKAFGTIVRNIYKQHGVGGFYLGLQARLAHVASIITSQLVVYDLVKMSLGLPVTGSH